MNDQASLLNELRIDRSAAEASPRRSRSLWWVIAAALSGASTVSVLWAVFGGAMTLPVKTAIAQEVPATQTATADRSLLDASGYIVARRRATVSAKVTGKVMELLIEEGKRVEADEVMARLDDSSYRAAVEQARAQVAQSEASCAAAQTALADADPIYRRNERQRDAGVVSAQAFDTATASYNSVKSALQVAARGVDSARANLTVARRNLEDTVVRAPFAGVVTEKAAQPGEIVSPMSAGGGFTRTGIGTIVDMDSLEVEVDVSENLINRVRAQQPVTVKLNAYSDWEIPGEVIAMIPTADRAKATVKVRIALKEKSARIIPEMGVRVSFLNAAETSPVPLANATSVGSRR